MATTAENVNSYLETDLPLVDVLTRGVANLRRTARWLIDEQGWDTTEDAVVSALRRYTDDNPAPPFAGARELRSRTSVDVATGFAYLTLQKSPELADRLSGIASLVDEFDRLYILEGERKLRIVTDDENLETLEEHAPDQATEEILSPVTLIDIQLPSDREAISLVGHAIGGIVHQGLHVLDVATCTPRSSVIVPAAETLDAFETVSALTQAR